MRFFPNRKNSQNIVPANNSNNKVVCSCKSDLAFFKHLWDLCALRHGIQIFNGSHFGLPPSSIHRMTGLGGKIVWTMTHSHKPHSLYLARTCRKPFKDGNQPVLPLSKLRVQRCDIKAGWSGLKTTFHSLSQLGSTFVKFARQYASAVWHGSLRDGSAMSIKRIQASVARRLLTSSRLVYTKGYKVPRKRSWNSLDGQCSDCGERFPVQHCFTNFYTACRRAVRCAARADWQSEIQPLLAQLRLQRTSMGITSGSTCPPRQKCVN